MTRSSRNADVDPATAGPVEHANDLRASRSRLAAETYAVRRQVERDLHDGVQQHLVALAVNLQLARQLVETDVSAVPPILDEIARDVSEALEGVRELAHRVYPPLLLDRGLSDAIRAAAVKGARPARVVAIGLDRYPEDVEAAVYFCCVDALHGRDSAGRSVTAIRVWQDGDAVSFEIAVEMLSSADEPGNAPFLTSMRDRLGAVGGRLTVAASQAGGIHVSGTIPLAP